MAEVIVRLPAMSSNMKFSSFTLLTRYLAPGARPSYLDRVDQELKSKLMPPDDGHQRILPEAARLRLFKLLADTLGGMPDDPHPWSGKDILKLQALEMGLHNLDQGMVSSPAGRASLLVQLVKHRGLTKYDDADKMVDRDVPKLQQHVLNILRDHHAGSAAIDTESNQLLTALRDTCLQFPHLFSETQLDEIRNTPDNTW